MDTIDNPLLTKAHQSGKAPHSPSTNVVPFEKPKKRVSAKTERLIGMLGLRYRPSVQTDLEEHAAMLALLTVDVADVPADLLERAIDQHVMKSPYMPKASELIAAAQAFLTAGQPKGGTCDTMALAERYNATMSPEHRNQGLRWNGANGDLVLER